MTALQEQARALGDPTRFGIFTYVAEANRPVDIAELTDHFSLNHNGIRQHVAKLVRASLVAEDQAPSTGRGRPRLVYTLDPAAASRWGVTGPYERLSVLLAEILRTGDAPADVGRRSVGRERPDASADHDPVALVVEAMERQGFEPVVRGTRAVTGSTWCCKRARSSRRRSPTQAACVRSISGSPRVWRRSPGTEWLSTSSYATTLVEPTAGSECISSRRKADQHCGPGTEGGRAGGGADAAFDVSLGRGADGARRMGAHPRAGPPWPAGRAERGGRLSGCRRDGGVRGPNATQDRARRPSPRAIAASHQARSARGRGRAGGVGCARGRCDGARRAVRSGCPRSSRRR